MAAVSSSNELDFPHGRDEPIRLSLMTKSPTHEMSFKR